MLSHEKARRDSEVRVSQHIEKEEQKRLSFVKKKVEPGVSNTTERNHHSTYQASPNRESSVELRFKSPMSTTLKFTKEQEEKRRNLAMDL